MRNIYPMTILAQDNTDDIVYNVNNKEEMYRAYFSIVKRWDKQGLINFPVYEDLTAEDKVYLAVDDAVVAAASTEVRERITLHQQAAHRKLVEKDAAERIYALAKEIVKYDTYDELDAGISGGAKKALEIVTHEYNGKNGKTATVVV